MAEAPGRCRRRRRRRRPGAKQQARLAASQRAKRPRARGPPPASAAQRKDETQMSDSPTIAGIYPPVPTFFDEHDDLDLATLREHLTRLKAAGIANIVALGSN